MESRSTVRPPTRASRIVIRLGKSRALRVIFALAILLAAVAVVRRYALRPSIPPPDAATLEHAKRVKIIRDEFGVPHIFGERDADAAFGLAYAHAEDDYPTIQTILAASRGDLGLLSISKIAIANDWYVRFIGVHEEVDAQYDSIPADVRAVLEGYARGLSYYAYLHPKEVDTRLLPFTGRDIAGGFIHKLPFMLGIGKVLETLRSDEAPALGQKVIVLPPSAGSNAHAVSSRRSSDGIARLNINSHQPWEGPVAWYEAHIHSNEGWNMSGGTFPGAPFILHGHNDHLGWAHTVNSPDVIDVYELVRDDAHPNQYKYDGVWKDLEVKKESLKMDIGVASIPIPQTFYRSVQGPVIVNGKRAFAVRYAGIGRGIKAAEEWFRMNKASSFDAWRDAMRIQGIPMFNTVYADKDRIFYVYNASLGKRPATDVDYTTVLPGDRSDVVFQEYLSFDELPQVLDPPAGFVQNCNSTPFTATKGEGNPDPARFPKSLGVEHREDNRSIRSLGFLGTDSAISREDFLKMKWDRRFDPTSRIHSMLLEPLFSKFVPANEDEKKAIELLKAWDGACDESSTAAALGLMAYRIVEPELRGETEPKIDDPGAALRDVIAFLKKGFGRVDVPLGEVQRLRRGAVDLPLGGGPDVLNASYSKRVDGHLVGLAGDSLVMIVELGPDGVRSESISPYGASNRKDSPHYADQAPLFVAHKLKSTLRDPKELEKHTERAYAPGAEAR